MKKILGAFLTLAFLASCSPAQAQRAINTITTRDISSYDFSYVESNDLTSWTITVTAKQKIQIMTITFTWHYLNNTVAKTDPITQKEIEIGESRNFKTTIEFYQTVAISRITTAISGKTYI